MSPHIQAIEAAGTRSAGIETDTDWNEWVQRYEDLVDLYNPKAGHKHDPNDPRIDITSFLGAAPFAQLGVTKDDVESTSISLPDYLWDPNGIHTATLYGKVPNPKEEVTKIPLFSWKMATAGLLALGRGLQGLFTRASLADAFGRAFEYQTLNGKGIITFDTVTRPMDDSDPLAQAISVLKKQTVNPDYLVVVDNEADGARTVQFIVDHALFLEDSKAFSSDDGLIFAKEVLSIPVRSMPGVVIHAGFKQLPDTVGFLPEYFSLASELSNKLEPLIGDLADRRLTAPASVIEWANNASRDPLRPYELWLRGNLHEESKILPYISRRLNKVNLPVKKNWEILNELMEHVDGVRIDPKHPVIEFVDLTDELEYVRKFIQTYYINIHEIHDGYYLRKTTFSVPRERNWMLAPARSMRVVLYLLAAYALGENASFVDVSMDKTEESYIVLLKTDMHPSLSKLGLVYPPEMKPKDILLNTHTQELHENLVSLLNTLLATATVTTRDNGNSPPETTVAISIPRTRLISQASLN